MAVDWQDLPFSHAVLLNPGAPLERGTTYPFVDMAAVNPGIRSVYATNQRKYAGGGSRFMNGDTLMARITPCLENGKMARFYVPNSDSSTPAHGSTEFIVIRGRPNVTDTEFVYYLAQWEETRNYAIGQMTGTSGRQRVPTDCFDHLIVPIPPPHEQRAIAHILGTIDDKIELNRYMNETLEEMARALFKSWFVDFDPVRAKMQGHDPGLPKHLADFFPDRLVNSELGEIPEGWEVKTLSSFGEIVTGKTPSTKEPEYFGDDVPFLRIPDMHRKMYALQTHVMLSSRGANSQPQKTIPPGSISVSCIATPGLVVLNHRNIQTNQQINSIIPRDQSLSKYLYWSCKHLSTDIKTGGVGGSVFSNMNKSTFSTLPVLNPKPTVIYTFDQFVSPMHATILANEKHNQILTQVRDTLLPKLISGEMRVNMSEHSCLKQILNI